MITDIVIVSEEHVGVIAAFPQLHHQIGQCCS